MLKKLWVLPVDIRLAAHNNKLRFRPRSYSYIGKVPVLDVAGNAVVGWITHRDVLQAYRKTLERSVRERPQQRPAAAGVSAPRALAELRQHRIVELELRTIAPDRAIKDIHWPEGSLVMAIRRGSETFVPTGLTKLQQGDRLTVLAPASSADHLADIVAGDGAPGEA